MSFFLEPIEEVARAFELAFAFGTPGSTTSAGAAGHAMVAAATGLN